MLEDMEDIHEADELLDDDWMDGPKQEVPPPPKAPAQPKFTLDLDDLI
jgi:hypothetical protein